MALLYQSGILTTLAYLMGERSVNATTSAPRANFVQKTLEECYKAYPWKFARTNATLSISSGIATLPTDFDFNHSPGVSFFQSSQEIDLDEVDEKDRNQVNNGDRAFWLSALPTGRFLLNTKDTDVSQIVVNYQTVAPSLDSSGTVGTPYPSELTLALGARRFVKLGQNPDADISQEQQQFKDSLNDDIVAQQLASPRRNRRSRQSQIGSVTGEF